jgi:lysophospholipase L1-like esterase
MVDLLGSMFPKNIFFIVILNIINRLLFQMRIILFISIFLISQSLIADILVINKGIGGHTTTDVIKRFDRDVRNVDPDHVVIFLGINDAANSKKHISITNYAKNLEKLVKLSQKAGAKTVSIVTIHPIIERYWKSRHGKILTNLNINEKINTYSNAAQLVARENGIRVIDFRTAALKAGEPKLSISSWLRNQANSKSSDGTHLTIEGNKELAKVVADSLKEVVSEDDKIVCLGDSITYGAHMVGAGTASGDTYPAWLSTYLNGNNKTDTPPIQKPREIIFNGNFEFSGDKVHADGWKSWNVRGRHEGKTQWKSNQKDAKDGISYLSITSTKQNIPAFIVTPRGKVKDTTYKITFWAKGHGRLRYFINQLEDGKASAYPMEKENIWSRVSSSWKKYSMIYTPTLSIFSAGLGIHVIGQINIDSVSFAPYSTNAN